MYVTYVDHHVTRKAPVLWVFQPEKKGALQLSSPGVPGLPDSFAAVLALPRFFAELILDDDRGPRPVYDEYGHILREETPRPQHGWRVRTYLPEPVQETRDALHDREYILEAMHPYLVHETKRILASAIRKEPYEPSPFEHHTGWERLNRPKKTTSRTSHGWQPHSGRPRLVLANAFGAGARDLADAVYATVRPTWEATGYISPAGFAARRARRQYRLVRADTGTNLSD